jgi:hypothetical protein
MIVEVHLTATIEEGSFAVKLVTTPENDLALGLGKALNVWMMFPAGSSIKK